ncbi:hypothetical protein [Pseudonocardia asaccharolytica]|uniref:Uncharacterized protein n=1 Tax=Pseudonocardia asaccharolytica DSM 44247 = NBRC 16224 TaxID=1123024 RepID=A0A511D7B5_9PSEU|nr:hypothetical protein [Pseudonocardia asaccharolytica]GEL20705.1 hypothetical protein PA7_45420 [Pseudonocardia asaccharolytica DSM 44247 = NBRC 16224]
MSPSNVWLQPHSDGPVRADPTSSPSALRDIEPGDDHLSLADATERLMAEFGSRLDLALISRVVLDCRHDLQSEPPGALPELVERLARRRILRVLEADADPGAGP